ncbi:MAG: PIG-L family deacetylase, partial [Isosphaeraceae bacterium]
VIMHFSDAFTRPCRFEPHVVVDIDDVFDRLVDMLHRHESQFYEWLPYNAGYPEQVPQDDDARRNWLAGRMRQRIEPLADRYRDALVQTYGQERGAKVRLIEAFEVSEYGAPLDAEARARLFPFLPHDARVDSPVMRKAWADEPAEADRR